MHTEVLLSFDEYTYCHAYVTFGQNQASFLLLPFSLYLCTIYCENYTELLTYLQKSKKNNNNKKKSFQNVEMNAPSQFPPYPSVLNIHV